MHESRVACARRSISPTHENASRQSASELSSLGRQLTDTGHALLMHFDADSSESDCHHFDHAFRRHPPQIGRLPLFAAVVNFRRLAACPKARRRGRPTRIADKRFDATSAGQVAKEMTADRLPKECPLLIASRNVRENGTRGVDGRPAMSGPWRSDQ